MKTKEETFESLIKQFEYRYDLRTVFDDFLTLCICAFSHNPLTGKSHDEELYLETIEKYKNDELRHRFPEMLAVLVNQMEERVGSGLGNDVLGEFYEQNLYRKGASQYFTPWPICSFMAKITGNNSIVATHWPLRILDPCCGSGRMLLASAQENGKKQEYYGIDIDQTCVKMTAINLFLNGMFHSEVMCSNALSPNDFRVSYKISFLPFGIFRITEKEDSLLWHLQVNSFTKVQPKNLVETIFEEQTKGTGHATQLVMF